MSAAELKSLVKALNGASSAEVRLIILPYGLPVKSVRLLTLISTLFAYWRPGAMQEIVGVLKTLKQEVKISEAVLRVSPSVLHVCRRGIGRHVGPLMPS